MVPLPYAGVGVAGRVLPHSVSIWKELSHFVLDGRGVDGLNPRVDAFCWPIRRLLSLLF